MKEGEMTTRQLANYLRISIYKLRSDLVKGRYPFKYRKEVLYGGRGVWLIDKESVDEW